MIGNLTLEPSGSYLQGNSLRMVVEGRDFAGNLLTAENIRLVVLKPGGVESEVAPSTVGGVGQFQRVAVLTLDVPGRWLYRFERVTHPWAALEGEFLVSPRSVSEP